ncbi:MAG TPA: sulfotransferase [Actinomycetes bacterium]|nr:sulfotransferase [Actinomycetes bacterium]
MGDVLSDDQQLVFVGGLHRSGTTLLARLLASHPEATGLAGTGAPEDEGQHIQDVYPPAERHGGTGRFALKAKAHLTETSPLANPENAQRLWDAWRPYWDSDQRFLVEKSPPNLVMGRFLQQLYPSAAFVFIVRHPVAVMLATRKWRKRTSLSRLMSNWFRAHDRTVEDLPQLRQAHIVSYEWLIKDAAGVMSEVSDFLHMPGTIDTSSVDGAGSSRYEQEWLSMRSQRHRGAERVRTRYSDRARSYGYDLDAVLDAPRHPLIEPNPAR